MFGKTEVKERKILFKIRVVTVRDEIIFSNVGTKSIYAGFLLIFWVLHVYEIGPFMPNSSVFIFLMLRALYRMICKSSKKNFGKKSLNVPNVKLLSNFFFNIFGFFMPFW